MRKVASDGDLGVTTASDNVWLVFLTLQPPSTTSTYPQEVEEDRDYKYDYHSRTLCYPRQLGWNSIEIKGQEQFLPLLAQRPFTQQPLPFPPANPSSSGFYSWPPLLMHLHGPHQSISGGNPENCITRISVTSGDVKFVSCASFP